MAKTMLNVKTDVAVKKAAQRLAKEIGVPLSTIVNAQLKRFVSERRVELQAPLVPNVRTRKILDEAEREWKKGKRSPFKSVSEMIRALEA